MDRIIQKVSLEMPKKNSFLRVAAYCRVSSGKDAMLHSLSAQVSYYSQLIQSHPNWLYCGVYSDEGITGTKVDRENFLRLIKDCNDGKIDLVITKSISRFARNTVTLLNTIRDLKMLGIGVIFEEQHINTLSTEGELMLTILASYAQEESLSASENQKWRLRSDFKQGVLPMFVQNIYGYKRTPDGGLEIVPEEAETVRLIFSLYLKGYGAGKIAEYLNENNIMYKDSKGWAVNTIKYLLSNEKYTGDLLLQKTYVKDHLSKKQLKNKGEYPKYYVTENHEPIISRDDYEKVQEKRQKKIELHYKGKPSIAYPFSRIIHCEKCGKNYRRKTTTTGPVWICTTYDHKGKKECDAKQIPERKIYELVNDVLNMDRFDETTFKSKIAHIVISNSNRVIFQFHDGCIEERTWSDRSRSESWTDEMREKARKKQLNRSKQKWQNK